MRQVHIGTILSVTTDYLLAPGGMSELQEFIEWMVDSPVFTHGLMRAAAVCKPALLAQHPQLADVDLSGTSRDNYAERLAAQVARFGEFLTVARLAPDAYERRDPVQELIESRSR